MLMVNAERAIDPVSIFGALGDATRLKLVDTMSDGESRSISDLASGFGMSRQAITKHLKVLEAAGLVANDRVGRETQFRLETGAIDAARDYLDRVSRHWDEAIGRLKDFLGEG
jgi:DNA-binding transcriptional ArsR family regulator